MLKSCLNCGLEFDGAPQARFHSNACRVAYSRREVVQEVEAEKEEVEQELALTRTRTPPISEEEYVARALARDDLFDRGRAERYARWRYRGYVAGEVARL